MKLIKTALLFCILVFIASCTKEDTFLQQVESPAEQALSPLAEMDAFLNTLHQQTWTDELAARYDELEQREFEYLGSSDLTRGVLVDEILNVPADYATIQEAVDAANDGDGIVVAAGTYTENVTIDGPSTLRIVASGEVTLNGQFVINSGTQILIKGFTIQSTFDGFIGIVVNTPNQFEVLRAVDNTIDLINELCVGIKAFDMGIGNSLIKGNTITFAANTDQLGGIDLEGGNNNRIAGNSITYTSPFGGFGGAPTANAIVLANSNSLVKNNSIQSGESGIFLTGGNNNTVNQNEVFNCEDFGIVIVGSSNNQITNNTSLEHGECDIIMISGLGNSESGNTADCISGF